MKLFCKALLFLFSCISHVQAESITLPIGLKLHPDPSLTLTYQTVSSYDPVKKVIAGWDGDKLQYFISVSRLSTDSFDHEQYFPSLTQELRAALAEVKEGRSGSYKTVSSMSVNYLELIVKYSRSSKPRLQIHHLITNGKNGFLAVVAVEDINAGSRALRDTKRIFQSASLHDESMDPIITAESPYIGVWTWQGKVSNGRPAIYTVNLMQDLSFSGELKINNKTVIASSGYWSVSGNRLLKTHAHTKPALQADKKQEQDEIISLAGNLLVLRSTVSGEERQFFRQ